MKILQGKSKYTILNIYLNSITGLNINPQGQKQQDFKWYLKHLYTFHHLSNKLQKVLEANRFVQGLTARSWTLSRT